MIIVSEYYQTDIIIVTICMSDKRESYNERCWVNCVWQNFTIRIFAWTFKLSVDNYNALSFTHTNIMCKYLDLISKLEQSEPLTHPV